MGKQEYAKGIARLIEAAKEAITQMDHLIALISADI